MTEYFLAIDIGASSGRHIVGWEENGELRTREVYRFPNGVRKENGHLTWDTEHLFREVKNGIAAALREYGSLKSFAIDTWAVDYVLLRGDEPVLPVCAYRDSRTEDAVREVHSLVPFEELYRRTGIQFQPFNTVYQLTADQMVGRLEGVTDLMMLPEYLTWRLTGVRFREYTNATSTGLVNAVTGGYDPELIRKLKLPERLFSGLDRPGKVLGGLLPEVQAEVGGNVTGVACATHDTASCVEGIPMPDDALYLSSGTWSLLGAKLPAPITTPESRAANFTNEGGVGYIRYLKNIMGMWIVNRLRDELCPETGFGEIVRAAEESGYEETLDVNHPSLLAPESMKQAFESLLEKKPETVGDTFRCAFRSLARCYAETIRQTEEITGRTYSALYIVGGGAKNGLLNRMTEEAAGIRVVPLPIEATALGSLKLQMKGNGGNTDAG